VVTGSLLTNLARPEVGRRRRRVTGTVLVALGLRIAADAR
jgi:threonine/homoserine/homoserine lactone efflux protein